MVSSGMFRRVALVRTDDSEQVSASITLCRMLITANVPSSPIIVILMMEALISSETSVLTRATRRNNIEDAIIHNQNRENLKSYIALTGSDLWRRSNVSPVKYELEFYIPAVDILHSHRRENLKSYNVLLVTRISPADVRCVDI
jgi:hypothetical protein